MYYAPIETVVRLLDTGKVRPVGTRRRVRAVIAMTGAEGELRAARPPIGQRYSDNREAPDNPRGVWRFRKLA